VFYRKTFLSLILLNFLFLVTAAMLVMDWVH